MGKIIETHNIDEWDILSDDGWHPITHVHKTIQYDVWELKTITHTLKCADEHIVIDVNRNEVYVYDLVVGDDIITSTGIESVTSVQKLDVSPESMYDITVDSGDHTLFTNGILSHNTTMSTVFLVHHMLFNKDKTVAVLANKESSAKEILRRIKGAYEMLPLWLQQGCVKWNEKSIQLENGMRLIAATTSSDSISGETVSLLYLDEFAKVKPHVAEEFITATLPVVSSGKKSKVIIVSCVTDDTFVITPSGIREVSDFVDYDRVPNGLLGYTVDDYKVYGKCGFNDGNIIVNSGNVPTNIITSTSSEVECSLKHPWFVCDNGVYDWKKTKDLSGREYIAIQYGQDVWGSNNIIPKIDLNNYQGNYNDNSLSVITKDFAYFLGLYISNGNSCTRVNANGNICYTGINITCNDYVCGVLDSLRYKYTITNGVSYTINSVILCDIMVSLGFDLGMTSDNMIIPKRLFEMSRDNICSLVQGIMDGNGNSHKNNGTVYIKSLSKRLIQQMRTLFNNFGILSTWVDDGVSPLTKLLKSPQFYGIELSKNMSNKYYDTIGFRLKQKQLNECCLPENIIHDPSDIIPYSGDVILGLQHTHPEDYKHIIDYGVIDIHTNSTHFDRVLLLQHKDFMLSLNNPLLIKMYEFITDDIKWETINNITESHNDVYDFSLKENGSVWCHSVVFNNILGSNTPVGMNHFYAYWKGATELDPALRNNFYPIKVQWWDHPNRDEKWKTEALKTFNNDINKFNQEFGIRFLGSTNTLIDPEILERIVTRQPVNIKLSGALKIYEEPKDNVLYIMGVDSAKGTGRDYSVVQVLKIVNDKKISQVAMYRCNTVSPHDFAQVCIGISLYYHNCQMMVENNGVGEAVASTMWYEYENENMLNIDPKGLGIRATTKTKLQANILMKRYVDEKYLTLVDDVTISELSRYIEKTPNVFQAETKTTHDDCVTSLIWALYFITTEYFDNDNLDVSTLDEQYDLTNSGPIMFLPD